MPPLRHAFFMDRDGVINREQSYVTRPDDLVLLPGVAAALRRLRQAGFLAIVVTNQSMIARGLATEADLAAVHARLHVLLAAQDAHLDAIYHCPHYAGADVLVPGNPYQVACECRKPAPGLLLRAIREWQVDPAASWMAGDGPRDIEAGLRAGLRTIGIGDRARFRAPPPDHVFASLHAAVMALVPSSGPGLDMGAGA